MVDARLTDRARGSFLGLAVGDALGTTLEFAARDTRPHHAEMTGGGPFRLAPGVWTDDTSMAVALADSLVTCGGFDPADLMARFLRWMEQGDYSPTGHCFDIGVTTRQALNRFRRTGDPFAGPTAEDTAGNGALMRLAPAVLHAFPDPAACCTLAAEQGRTTHGAPQSDESCRFLADLLRRALAGEAKDSLLAPQHWPGHPAVRAVAGGGWRELPRDAIRSSGYVIDTLQAALWSVAATDGFEAAVVLAVNLADDADTVGAVTGQLAGALYGQAGIPRRWLDTLAWRERITDLADALIAAGGKPSDAACG